MAGLIEKTVEKRALDWLKKEACARPDVEAVVARRQAWLTGRRGRADGLIACRMANGYIYTISLEAKSHKTLKDVIPKYLNRRWFLHTFVVGILVFAIVAVVGSLSSSWIIKWLLPTVIAFVAMIGFLAITADSFSYAPIAGIDRLGKYPADEKVLALSARAFNLLNGDHLRLLRKACKNKKMELLIVGPSRRRDGISTPTVRFDTPPEPIVATKDGKGYIREYAASDEILNDFAPCADANNRQTS